MEIITFPGTYNDLVRKMRKQQKNGWKQVEDEVSVTKTTEAVWIQ